MIERFLLAFISVISLIGYSQDFKPSQPRWYTGPECGVAAYQRSVRSECGVKKYIRMVSPACQVESFNSGRDMSCPGSKSGGQTFIVSASVDSGSNIKFDGRGLNEVIQGDESLHDVFKKVDNLEAAVWGRGEFKYWSCRGTRETNTDDIGRFSYSAYWITCVSKDYAAECRSPTFGIASYTSCEDPSHGVAQYNECEDPEVVAAYNTCLIRKTMPEIEAYINSTRESIQLLGRQLAKAESDYLFNSKQAKLASCLIDRYHDEVLYEDIVEDLKNTYSAMFGENYSKDQFDCAASSERISYTLNGSPCESFSDSEISQGLKSQDLSSSEELFYRSCDAETSARSLRKWFQFHEYETSQLLADSVAGRNERLRNELSTLKNELFTSGQLGSDCPSCNLKILDLRIERTPSSAKP